MSYNTSKFPSDVSRLFKPRPPLEYKRPVDYPPEKRQTCPHITGVSQLLGEQLSSYVNQFPQGSDNKYLQKYEEASHAKDNEYAKLNQETRGWEPHKDPNIKETDPFKTIFVGRLPYDTTEMELQREFSKFGDIERIRVVRDKVTNKSKGYAFVLFTNPQSSRMACKEIGIHRGLEIKGRIAIVDIERGRTIKYFKPRRLGGGLGGRGYTKTHGSMTSNVPSKFGNRPITTPRPAYSGPSRFSSSTPLLPNDSKIPNRYGGNMARRPGLGGDASPSQPPPATTSYRSRYSRTKETRSTNVEEPDY
ncbi:hypothetical protein ZYGR_0I03510 [Zygosaccharomyces rouxii]|uniref:U1 small nuclear ribonucleoprotein 70 kDa n=2 Tax=Zygosaccharomyces rouxii TaxID=4956 RepID=C5DTG6_ZYGRC|nr:uncharacterized protein ZYRO0C08382g [Zygosaccharomyces rouxii]KAH9201744.1 hypothetical protein LQ764DRAFT_233451 [Zygosaccharomyces rouxii]GAV48054.1 hypothetical protein ZYGR_0I03510 [Zygosaccharomyces rouxii]CAR27077.1 ZYRO0C08382p [Zygosaccharomyces rouxii]